MSSLEAEQANSCIELEMNLPSDGKRLQQNDASTEPSSTSDDKLSEDGETNPMLLLNQEPLETLDQYCEVEAINCNSTATDLEMSGLPRTIITLTPSITEIPNKPSTSEICDGLVIQKTDSLSPKHTYGMAKNSFHASASVPSLLENDEQNSTKSLAMKTARMVVAVAVIVVVWGLMLLPTVFYHLPQVSVRGGKQRRCILST